MSTPPSDGRALRRGLVAGGALALAVVAVAVFSSSPAPLPAEPADAGPRRAPRRVARPDAGTPRPAAATTTEAPPPRFVLARGADAGSPLPPASPGPAALREALGRRLVLKGRPTLPAAATAAGGATLDKEAIRGAIREIQPLVRACYEQGLRQDATLGGDATLSFTVVAKDGRGLVREAEFDEARSSMGNVLVQACMLDALSKATFPVPQGDGETRVTYPFRFSSGADGGGR